MKKQINIILLILAVVASFAYGKQIKTRKSTYYSIEKKFGDEVEQVSSISVYEYLPNGKTKTEIGYSTQESDTVYAAEYDDEGNLLIERVGFGNYNPESGKFTLDRWRITTSHEVSNEVKTSKLYFYETNLINITKSYYDNRGRYIKDKYTPSGKMTGRSISMLHNDGYYRVQSYTAAGEYDGESVSKTNSEGYEVFFGEYNSSGEFVDGYEQTYTDFGKIKKHIAKDSVAIYYYNELNLAYRCDTVKIDGEEILYCMATFMEYNQYGDITNAVSYLMDNNLEVVYYNQKLARQVSEITYY